MYRLKLKHSFSSAHQLENAYDKDCNDYVHGHNWKVLVEIETESLINNMVVDFTKIKEVIDILDHKMLNDILDCEPTAENLAKHLKQEIEKIRKDIKVKVTIWETEGASIQYE